MYIISKKLSTLAATVAVASFIQAQNFEVDNINYEIVNPTAKTVQVVESTNATGDVDIPVRVRYNNEDYTVIAIADYAFRGNENITGILIPETVDTIGAYAFENCIQLSSVTIADGVSTIKTRAFETCPELLRITIPASVTTLGNNVFVDCRKLLSITVDAANPNYSSEAGVLFDKNKTILHRYPTGKTNTSYTIPNSVKTIDIGAFEGGLFTQLTIPNSVETIREAAFINCLRITQIDIPNSVKTIGIGAFRSCLNLQVINLSESINFIGAQSFLNTPKLLSINVNENNLHFASVDGVLLSKDGKRLVQYPTAKTGDYTVPNGVENIESYAFSYGLGLTGVHFPASLKSIGRYAFFGTTNVKNVSSAAVEPPTLGIEVFLDMPVTRIPLRVPVGSADKYKAKNVWKDFNPITEDATLSIIDNNTSNVNIKVYPNPTKGIFFIETSSATSATVFSVTGQSVKSAKLNKGKNEMNISNLSAGVYLIKVGNETFKVLKK